MLAWCVPLLTFEQMTSRDDPRCTEVRREFRPVAHHVVISDIKVVFDIAPLVVGKDVAEWRVASRDRLVPAQLNTGSAVLQGVWGGTYHVHGENVLIRQVCREMR